ncbi:MAG: RNA polymerase sigma factor [Phycisphaerales bacterium]|nr:RNA polymerase sigma factor [Phycisphaerales bacterium]
MQTPASEKLDPEAFATMYEQSRSTLRIVAAGECGFDLADDIVQHGAIVALQRLDQFTPGTNFLAWTSTIVRGVARNQRRSEQRHRSKILRLSSLFPKSGQRNQQITQNTEQTQRPISPDLKLPDGFDDRIRDALDTLTAPQRTCLLMRTLLDHSYSEIGEILEMPAATVRSHVYRSRSALLDLLEEPQTTEGGER